MIIKIGGVEIDKSLDVSNTTQLKEGLEAIGVDETSEFINWIADLSIAERMDLAQLVNQDVWGTVASFLTFGLF